MEGVNRRGWVPQISLNSSNSNSRHPSVLRDNGKTSLLGVDTQRSCLFHGMCQDEKIGK